MQSGTSLWASQVCSSTSCGLRDNTVCSIRLRLRCGVRSWHSSLTNLDSQPSNCPGHDEQPQTDLCDGDYELSVEKVLFPLVESFLPMSHSDVPVPPVSNTACSVNMSGWRNTIVLSHGFPQRSLRGAQEGQSYRRTGRVMIPNRDSEQPRCYGVVEECLQGHEQSRQVTSGQRQLRCRPFHRGR